MPVRKRPQVGDYVSITFLDHAENSHEAMVFELVGKLVEITRKSYKVYTWLYADPVQRAKDTDPDQNEDFYIIVKSAVSNINVLR